MKDGVGYELTLVQMIVLEQQNTATYEFNSHFLHNSNHLKPCFRKMQFLAISHQFYAVNF